MSKISSWSANILSPPPFLTAATLGETLELRPSGSWTAVHANALESLFDIALPTLQQATNLKIDMTLRKTPRPAEASALSICRKTDISSTALTVTRPSRDLNTSGARCHMLSQQTKRSPLDRYARFELNPRPSEQML